MTRTRFSGVRRAAGKRSFGSRRTCGCTYVLVVTNTIIIIVFVRVIIIITSIVIIILIIVIISIWLNCRYVSFKQCNLRFAIVRQP